jgi:hypothetical protein
VVVGVVPPGYDTLSIGSQQIPIRNQAFVIDPKLAVSPGTLSGPRRDDHDQPQRVR